MARRSNVITLSEAISFKVVEANPARGQLVAGLTGYYFRSPEPLTVFRRGDTWEAYAGARAAMQGAPLIGEAMVYWDLDRVGGAYGEVAATLQIPVWVGIEVKW